MYLTDKPALPFDLPDGDPAEQTGCGADAPPGVIGAVIPESLNAPAKVAVFR